MAKRGTGGAPAGGSNRLTIRETSRFNRNSSAIAGVLDNLKSRLAVLEREIRADRAGKKEYEDQLDKLERRKQDILKRLRKNEAWAEQFDRDIGPFESNYTTMTADMSSLYNNAKAEHRKGLGVLMDQFGYHPAYKRHGDTFTAVPFRPR